MIIEKQKTQIKQTLSLPPGFGNLSEFSFGELIIELNINQLQQLQINKFSFSFFGCHSFTIHNLNKNKKTFEFPIKTSLWHFYQYLYDMKYLQLKLYTNQNEQLICKKNIQLLDVEKIFNKTYTKGNYIANSVQLCDIYDIQNQNKGYVMIKMKTQFDEEIHQQICEIIDFQILKKKFQLKQTKQCEKITTTNQKYFQNNNNNNTIMNQQNLLNLSNNINLQSNLNHVQEDESRMIQDDIDRMIVEMQNKPYDSSRYIENSQNIHNNNSFTKTQRQKINQNRERNNFHLTESIIGSKNHQNLKNKTQNCYFNEKLPPLPYRNQLSTHTVTGNSTIYSQKSISPLNQTKRSISATKRSSHKRQFNNHSNIHRFTQKNGTLKIHLHQLMGRQLEDDSLFMKIYLNYEQQEILSCKGILQGEVIIFNQKTQISDCYLNQIKNIRFELQNQDKQILYRSEFKMERLLMISKLQGIFMLNFHPINQQFQGDKLVVSQEILRKIEKPHEKTLRVCLSYSQQLDVIQMYINLSRFRIDYKKCKYKIPFTKQTVEFESTQFHYNIFPHSKNVTKFMIQFWDEKTIIGVSQINLNHLKNINKNILEFNIEPIYLYDSFCQIRNIFTQHKVGKFNLILCCGNVRQIQHVLNKNMQNKSQINQLNHSKSINFNQNKYQVEYDDKLKIYVKDRKQKNQIQIQVDDRELQLEKQTKFNKKYSLPVNKVLNQENYQQLSSNNQFLKVGQKNISKIHELNLNQQIQIDDDDQDIEQQQQYYQIDSKQINQVKQRKHNEKIQKVNEKEKTQQTVTPIKFIKNIKQLILNKLKQHLVPLTQKNFQIFRQLKAYCKPYLLFNFIQIDHLIKGLTHMGISYSSVNNLLQILQPTNGMVNFNILNDFIISLQIEGGIKENLISNKLFVKLFFIQYYELQCTHIQQSNECLNNKNKKQKIVQNSYENWLSSEIILHVTTLDQSIDFNEFRNILNELGYRISMNDYNIIKQFLQNQRQVIQFLTELSSSTKSLKTNTNIYELLKLSIIQQIIKNKKQTQLDQKYQKNVLGQIYGSRLTNSMTGDQFNSSNNSLISSSRVVENLLQTKQIQAKKYQINIGQSKKYQQQQQQSIDQGTIDDFIISKLNQKSYQNKNQRKQLSDQKIQSNQKLKQNQKQLQKKLSQTVFKKIQSSLITQNNTKIIKKRITIDGLQNCKSTYQCQLDLELNSPYLKITINSPYQQKFYLKSSDISNVHQYQIHQSQYKDEEQIEGDITLMDLASKGQIKIAMARFVVIQGIKSVYALKTVNQEIFCGLVNILIQ